MKPGDKVLFHYMVSIPGRREMESCEATVLEDHGDDLLTLRVNWPADKLETLEREAFDESGALTTVEMVAHKEYQFQVLQTEMPKSKATPPESGSWSPLS